MPPPRFILLAALPLLANASQMVTYKLQHAFGLTAAFQDRGNIEVLVDSGALTLIPPPDDQPVLVPEGSLDEIAREMRQPDGGLYRLRAQRSDASAPVIMTSVRLCDIVRAGFWENITLTLDVGGRLLGLEYTPRMSRLSPTTCLAMKSPLDQVNRNSDGKKKEAADAGPAAFSTLIKAAVDQAGQSVPVVVPGQRPPMIQIRYDEQERQPEVQKSFIQKYWIFIVLAFLLLNSGTAPPEEEGPAGGGAGGQGAPPPRGHGQGAPRGGGGGGGGGGGPRRE